MVGMRQVFWFLIIGVISGAYTTLLNLEKDELVMVQIIFRHGDRTFRNTYDSDPYKSEIFWPEGFYQLTNAGKEKQYKFGQFLRRRYGKFLGPYYSDEKITYRSSDTERTLMSALTNAASLFPPTGFQVWNSHVNWQPVPVHTVPVDDDYLVYQSITCDLADELRSALLESNQATEFLDRYKNLLETIELHMGLQSKSNTEKINNFYRAFDVLNTEYSRGLVLPLWAENVVKYHNADLNHIIATNFALWTQTTEMKKSKGGLLVKEIFDHFKDKTLSTLDPDRILFMYSAHDNTIVNTLNTLGIFKVKPIVPPYASSLHFELYRRHIGHEHEYYVQIFYRTDNSEYLSPIHVSGCGTKCPLDQLYELFDDILPKHHETYESLCRKGSNIQDLIEEALESFEL